MVTKLKFLHLAAVKLKFFSPTTATRILRYGALRSCFWSVRIHRRLQSFDILNILEGAANMNLNLEMVESLSSSGYGQFVFRILFA